MLSSKALKHSNAWFVCVSSDTICLWGKKHLLSCSFGSQLAISSSSLVSSRNAEC